jgi:2-polyprenyl-3-methyl-5-hydroxy-6-metoxy-1,4-benzoquinol methylase
MSNLKDIYNKQLEYISCNLCGNNDYEVIYPSQYELAQSANLVDTFKSSGDQVLLDQLVRCKNCGLQYLNPRLKEELVIQGYSSGEDETFVSQKSAREHTFEKSLKMIEKWVPQRGRILDIGTAGGSFLGMAHRRGWEVAGCEPSRWLSQWGTREYGISITPGTLFDMQLEQDSFEAVTLWDVLEHTGDPTAVLKECHRVLKPDGLLVVNYPDINSLVARMMGRKWVFLLSVHLYYFTRVTMNKMLEKTGFQTVEVKKHWQSLELGYILQRMKPYMPFLPGIASGIIKFLGMEHCQIPYWMGQVLFMAICKK